MPNWITGKELIKRWDIMDFELFEYLKKGLQPYTRHNIEILDSDSLEREPIRSEEEIRAEVYARFLRPAPPRLRPVGRGGIPPPSEIEKLAREHHRKQKSEIITPPGGPYEYMSFSLPASEKGRASAIARLMDCWFKKDNVLEIERKHRLGSRQYETPQNEESAVPTIIFYRKGDYWLIGEKGKEEQFKHSKGLSHLYYLLRYPGEKIPVINVYHQGSPVLDFEKPMIEDSLSYKQDSCHKKTDLETDRQIRSEIDNLKEQIKDLRSGGYGNPEKNCEEIEEKEKQIFQCENYLKEGKGDFGKEQKRIQNSARINVQKAIKTALDRIFARCPFLEQFLQLRNAKNASERQKPGIITGGFCSYQESPQNPVVWILDPAEIKNSKLPLHQ